VNIYVHANAWAILFSDTRLWGTATSYRKRFGFDGRISPTRGGRMCRISAGAGQEPDCDDRHGLFELYGAAAPPPNSAGWRTRSADMKPRFARLVRAPVVGTCLDLFKPEKVLEKYPLVHWIPMRTINCACTS
jgi:hypothetical protein